MNDCLEFVFNNNTGGYECSKCFAFFFLSEGKCSPISIFVDKCSFYSEDGKCRQCEEGYYFDTSLNSCQISRFFEANCVEFIVGGQCSVCKKGFYMDFSGNCLSCSVNSGVCDFCNPLDPSECLACKTGYYMNKEGICLQ